MIIHNPILTGSFTVNGTDVSSITSSAASLTSLNAYTASQNIRNGTYATTGSNTFAGVQTINSNLVVTGSITAATLVVQTITSSVDFVTGSTRFGSLLANAHQFTGSVSITGSLAVVTNGTEFQVTSTGVNFGNVISDTHNITGSVGISGSLSGTSANFSGNVTAGGSSVDTSGGLYSNIAVNATLYSRYSLLSGGTARGRFQFDGTDVSMISTTTGGKLQLGTIGSNSLEFVTNDSLKMTLTSAGNVGIGTSSPGRKLVVVGGNGNQLELDNTGQTYTQAFWKINGVETGTIWASTSEFHMYTYGTQNILFSTNNTERMRITSGGLVGIGTTNPAVQLQINGSLTLRSSVNRTIQLYNDGTVAADIGGNLEFRGTYRNSDLDSVVYSRIFGGKENASNGNFAGYMSFSTYEFPNSLAERLRITSSGTLVNASGIYDTSAGVRWIARQGGNDRIIADGNGYVYMPFLTSGSGIDDLGWWSSSGGSWTYNGMLMRISSSARYKKNIRDLELDSTKVFDLRTISYENNELTATDGLTSFGLLAEDVAEKIPMLATYNEEGLPEGVQYKMLAVLLLEEMKKMKLEIDELKNK